MKTNKFLAVLLTFCIFGMNLMPVSAASYKLNIEKESADKKDLENDQGYISKKIINSNPENGEVTVELTVSNKSQKTETEVTVKENAEIVIVLDESGSMSTTVDLENGLDRYDIVVNSAKELVNNILANSKTTKIGTVSFASDASITQTLTNDKALLDAVYSNGRVEYGGTNTPLGLTLAESLFSNQDNSKVIILLTDGQPNSSTATKNKLIELAGKGINIITMLTDTGFSNAFGTVENPTAGKLYMIEDSEITTIVKDSIFSDVMEIVKKNDPITEVKITDYFPKDITDNFEFSYVEKPATGTISETIDENNQIVYTVEELKGGEEIKISYKLKLKNMNDEKLLNKVISTNEKVVLNYKDPSAVEKEVTLTSSPSIKLIKVEEPKEDVEDTVENPPTGLYYTAGILTILIAVITGIVISKKKNYFSKI